LISVIIPAYNVEDYIHVCLNSVLSQTYQDFEIICIDDCSTDSTAEILEYFAHKDSRIRVLKNDSNRGPGYSRNRGLDEAKGKYISFLDGDDWLSPKSFELLIEKAEKDNLDVLMFKNVVYYEEPREFGREEYYDMKFMNKFENKVFNHWDLDKTKLFVMSNAPWNKFYLRSFLDENKIRFPNENLIHEDNPFFYKVITSAKRVSIIDKYLHNRRRRPDSIMTLNNERLFDNIDVMYKVLDVFFEDKKLYEYYKKEVLTYIFTSVFRGKYNQIEKRLKDKFYNAVQDSFKVYIEKYGIYEDIKENVDEDVLEFFKFDDIAGELIGDKS
jgi:glycosyltransferase involved in cell wall biosynthesis